MKTTTIKVTHDGNTYYLTATGLKTGPRTNVVPYGDVIKFLPKSTRRALRKALHRNGRRAQVRLTLVK